MTSLRHVALMALVAALPLPSVRAQGDSLRPETGRRSHTQPALEIVGFELLLNLFDRAALGADYRSDASTIRRNLRGAWVEDNDPYLINQFGHPYQGSIYHGLARASGLGYWTASAYTFAGSALWEIAGEVTPPSRNDQVASGIAGSFLGEALFRIANLVLERAPQRIGGARERSAALASPPLAYRRAAGSRRWSNIVDSRGAAYYRKLQAGATTSAQSTLGASRSAPRHEGVVEATLEYGLPGQEGYAYRRPFDYFAMQVTGSSGNGVESILTRGLLVGRTQDVGNSYRGLTGLFGSYDFIAPQLFRVSSTALSLGTVGQRWLAPALALQVSALGGVGWAAVGTNRGAREGDYQYGLAPQALVAWRLIVPDRASIDVTGREYYVSDVGATTAGGHDHIARAEAALTIRLFRQTALGLRYQWSQRSSFYPDLGSRRQVRSTFGLFYTLLSHDRFGATEWR